MAVANAYGKVVTSGSVFMYDVGDTYNSYIGEPTTNIFKHYGTSGAGAVSNNAVNFDVQGTTGFIRLGYGQTFGGYTIQPNDVVYKYDLGGYGCHYHGNDVSIPSGRYVTFTFDYYISPGAGGYPETNYLANMETGTGAGTGIASPNNLTGVWQTISVTTGPTTSGGNLRMLLYPGGCGGRLASSGYILYKNPQVELLPHKTPFTQTSRSVTGSLLPLVGNSTLNLSNVSFDSNAQIVFDGTDDRIDIGNFSVPYLTVSTWVYKTASTTNQGICRKENGWAVSQYNGTLQVAPGTSWTFYNTGYTIPLNTWVNIVYTYSGTGNSDSQNVYINGNRIFNNSNGSGPITSNSNTVNVGYDDNNWFWNGYISNTIIYNRALSAAEVQQNYNKYKTRFNLP
jgi:hypothetical protein